MSLRHRLHRLEQDTGGEHLLMIHVCSRSAPSPGPTADEQRTIEDTIRREHLPPIWTWCDVDLDSSEPMRDTVEAVLARLRAQKAAVLR